MSHEIEVDPYEVDPPEKKGRTYHGKGLYFEPPDRWRLKYKFAGREKFISLGFDISKDDALLEVAKIRNMLAKGLDPHTLRKAEEVLLRNDGVELTRMRIAKVFVALFNSREEAREYLKGYVWNPKMR